MAEAKCPRKIQKRVCEDRISSLSNDLLIHILLHVPTKDAVATTLLSKRWRFVWTMLSRLTYRETKNKSDLQSKSVWWFLDETMRFHKAPLLELLHIQLGKLCPIDVDVVKWVAKALDRPLCWLFFELLWNSEPTKMPNSLYTCKTLSILTLSRKIIVDVPSSVSLPSLTELDLLSVVYKEEDSHVRLLSSCPVLKCLKVVRRNDVDDNVKTFSIKVPSLLSLTYKNTIFKRDEDDYTYVSLVIDTPALVYLDIFDYTGKSCSTEYMPCLADATVDVDFNPDGNFLSSLSRTEFMYLGYVDNTMVPLYNAINYSRLIESHIELNDIDLCESLVVLLSNCPKLKNFLVKCQYETDHFTLLWNQPSSVPKCLSSHLEIFEWDGYAGREDEKEFIRYILENSKCLKRAGILLNLTCNAEEKQKIIEELKSMHRVSTSELLFSALNVD
ncbi:putative F-box/FBD/LRR-repeat protein [Cardamine amara subsp. amara]|uniref:F-box/FBD/LRR-repeat protein n=1 Tax=Cardamine amara subsp. amara TaxID=228776 RepID=A0ABD1A9F6_CARAN